MNANIHRMFKKMFERKTFSFASSKCFPIHTHRVRIIKLFGCET